MRLVIAALALCSSALLAKDLYVSASAGGNGDGSSAAPYRTIAEASAKLQPGDRCIIDAGIYREPIRPARWISELILRPRGIPDTL